ncbi:MAG: methylated-DNA--[protein]-cysteine S-methyltransferase [Alphaproteobacteria bacterium]|nr:methylated-DNA--[protein]-cysteine S-methyltransferase [Alphaproteobacteria bacterium]MBN2779864.1 methylated-DNA--[protein]-cysteine S-methyltransferase [Alphaproteobacteria bacterium]
MNYTLISSPIGTLLLNGDEKGLRGLSIICKNRKIHIPQKWTKNDSFFEKERQELEDYFKGKQTKLNSNLQIEGTSFQKSVWHALQKIPYGKTASYKEIAEKINNPRAVRAVGMACNKNPIALLIPCHRIVGSNGKLGGFAGGLEIKKFLLNLEQS